MKRAAIVSGTLGLGTALVFGAAVLASTLFPNGGTVQMGWNNGGWDKGIAMPAPMPMPVVIERGVIVDEGKDGAVEDLRITTGTEPAQP